MFQLISKLGKPMPGITKAAMDKLMRHDWPGNVRELKNVVERAAFLAEEEAIDVPDILFSHEIGDGLQKVEAGGTIDRKAGFLLRERVKAYEKRIVLETLKTSSSIRQAARRLGLSHTALLNRLKKWKHDEPMET